jgi:hypothetical protein
MRTIAVTVAAGFFGAGTAPDENRRHRQNNEQRKNLIPSHGSNITTNPNLANGILNSSSAASSNFEDEEEDKHENVGGAKIFEL